MAVSLAEVTPFTKWGKWVINNIKDISVDLTNPGASGSLFWLTHDDEFIIKTLQAKEADFLQRLLPGYYMNVQQNPRTLLPKFYGESGALKLSFIFQ